MVLPTVRPMDDPLQVFRETPIHTVDYEGFVDSRFWGLRDKFGPT